MKKSNDYDSIVTDNIANDYMRKLPKDLLSSEEINELFIRYRNGDLSAKDIIIGNNLRLVVSIAKEFVNMGMSFADLIQEGNLALLRAFDNFDMSRDASFSSYAYSCVKGEIMRALKMKARNVRLPYDMSRAIDKLRKATSELEIKLGREVSVKELADHLGFSEEKVNELLLYKDDAVSLNATVNDEDSSELEDFIVDENSSIEDEVFNESMVNSVRDFLADSSLKERDKKFIALRYGFYGKIYSFEEIGTIFGTSRQCVEQIDKRVLKKLRKAKSVKKLAYYMDNPAAACEVIDEARKKVRK